MLLLLLERSSLPPLEGFFLKGLKAVRREASSSEPSWREKSLWLLSDAMSSRRAWAAGCCTDSPAGWSSLD